MPTLAFTFRYPWSAQTACPQHLLSPHSMPSLALLILGTLSPHYPSLQNPQPQNPGKGRTFSRSGRPRVLLPSLPSNVTTLGLLVILVMVTAPPESWPHAPKRPMTLHPFMRPYNLLPSCCYRGNRYRPLLPTEAKGRAHCNPEGNTPRSLPSQ